MTKALAPFQFQDKNLSTITDDEGNPWFVAKDVCEILGLKNVSMVVSRLADYEKTVITTVDTAGFNNTMLIIRESGVYKLVFTSRKTEAEEFQRWVTETVLPQIRRTGSFGPIQGLTFGQAKLLTTVVKKIDVLSDGSKLLVLKGNTKVEQRLQAHALVFPDLVAKSILMQIALTHIIEPKRQLGAGT